MHISNAGLGDRNSGINTVQVRLESESSSATAKQTSDKDWRIR